jgi:transposase
MGLLLAVVVLSAGIQDRDGALILLDASKKDEYPRMKVMYADAAYGGECVQIIQQRLGWEVEVVQKESQGRWQKENEPPPEKKSGFEVLRWRWIVERTLAWLGHHRRLSKDYERLENSSETWILIVMSQLMLRRLAL